ncbi:hypothetical protein BSCA_1138 [Bifidobacterium scardovii]|uniref:Uncharacterized protein n=1 Tax=Bifidobacterium scardovii TaxID=158787 RepID=A0A087DJZ2_9BIFI|nr:hypothetical protein BSCA_1138 [Bifidobacterium scardovii]
MTIETHLLRGMLRGHHHISAQLRKSTDVSPRAALAFLIPICEPKSGNLLIKALGVALRSSGVSRPARHALTVFSTSRAAAARRRLQTVHRTVRSTAPWTSRAPRAARPHRFSHLADLPMCTKFMSPLDGQSCGLPIAVREAHVAYDVGGWRRSRLGVAGNNAPPSTLRHQRSRVIRVTVSGNREIHVESTAEIALSCAP